MCNRGLTASAHQLGIWESLLNVEYEGVDLKYINIIGVEPKEIDWGIEVSQELQKKIPQVIDQIKKEIRRYK